LREVSCTRQIRSYRVYLPVERSQLGWPMWGSSPSRPSVYFGRRHHPALAWSLTCCCERCLRCHQFGQQMASWAGLLHVCCPRPSNVPLTRWS